VTLNKHQQIEQRAYLIWQQKGCPQGSELDNWIQAETEVAAMTVADARPAPAPAPAPRSRRKKK